jgi:hypothetical protein
MIKAYAGDIKLPLMEDLAADGVTKRALLCRQRGAPRKRRIRSGGEGSEGRTAKVIRCSQCREQGHNARSCQAQRRTMFC